MQLYRGLFPHSPLEVCQFKIKQHTTKAACCLIKAASLLILVLGHRETRRCMNVQRLLSPKTKAFVSFFVMTCDVFTHLELFVIFCCVQLHLFRLEKAWFS